MCLCISHFTKPGHHIWNKLDSKSLVTHIHKSYELKRMHFRVPPSLTQSVSATFWQFFLKGETSELPKCVLCTFWRMPWCNLIALQTFGAKCKYLVLVTYYSCWWTTCCPINSLQIHPIINNLSLPLMKLNPESHHWWHQPIPRCLFKPPASAKEPPLLLPLQA